MSVFGDFMTSQAVKTDREISDLRNANRELMTALKAIVHSRSVWDYELAISEAKAIVARAEGK